MQFLARDEARSLQRKLDRQIADKPRPKLILYYRVTNGIAIEVPTGLLDLN